MALRARPPSRTLGLGNRPSSAGGASSKPIPAYISRAYGPTAGGGSAITLYGGKFTGTTGVTIGGVAATSVTVVSDTRITLVPPAGTSGAKDIVVTNAFGTGTLASAYTYQAGPSISGASLDVTSGSYNGGDLVTVTGASRIEAGMTITLGGVAHPVTIISPSSFSFITKLIAVTSSGAKDLVATNLDGQTGTKTSAFTYTAQSKVPAFATALSLETYLTTNGWIGDIVDGSGNLILRVQKTAAGYVPRSPLYVYRAQASTWAGAAMGFTAISGATMAWGATPGALSTGGLTITGGSVTFNGLAPIKSRHNSIECDVYISSVPGGPSTGDGIGCGQYAVSDARAYVGAIAFSTTWRAAGAFSSSAPDSITFTYSGTSWTPSVPDTWNPFGAWHQMSSANFSQNVGGTEGSTPDTTTALVGGASAGGGAGDNDFKPLLWAKGMNTNHLFSIIYFMQSFE